MISLFFCCTFHHKSSVSDCWIYH